MKKKAVNLLKTILLILVLCIPILQFGNGIDVQAATKLATPKLVSAKAQGTSKIKVTWKKVSGADSYKIYRKEYWGTKWKTIKTVSKNTVTFTDTRIDPGTYYSYTVRAVKNKTVLSGYNKKGVYAVTNLGYPANLKARTIRGSAIEISWKDNYINSEYIIYRRTEDSSWKKIKNGVYTRYFQDYSVEAGVQYYYAVRPCVVYDKIYKGSYDKNGIKAPIINPISSRLKFKVNERMLCKQGTFLLEFEDYHGNMNNITWNSSDSNVATVDKQGKVKGINYGETTITATAYGQTCECKIKVVTLAQVEKTDYILSKAETINIKWAEHGDEGFSYYSHIDDTNVLRCSWEDGHYEDGYYVCGLTVTPRTSGTTSITITNSLNNEIITLHITTQSIDISLSADKNNITISEKTTIIVTNTSGGKMDYVYNSNYIACKFGEWNNDDTVPLYITPKMNGTTTIQITDQVSGKTLTIYVTITGLKSSVQDNFNMLKQYIINNGSMNSSYDYFIRYNSGSNAYAILYDNSKGCISFITSLKLDDGTQIATTMDIYMTNLSYANVNMVWVNARSGAAFNTSSSFRTALVGNNSNMKFNVVSQTGFSGGYNLMQDSSNQNLHLLLDGCNKYLLRGRVGITFKDLGFESLEYNNNF